MASNYWIKLYHEMLDDPKIGRLTDSQFRLMINLFLLAGDCEQDGYLPCIDDISWRLRNPPTLKDDLDALIKYDIITEDDGVLVICKFSERQSAMSTQERSQRRHDRARKMEYYRTKSARKAHESGIDEDEDKDKDKDEDEDDSPPNFYSQFQAVIGLLLAGDKDFQYLKTLVQDYGEEKILKIAAWLRKKDPDLKSMRNALRSIDTAASNWGETQKQMGEVGKEFTADQILGVQK